MPELPDELRAMLHERAEHTPTPPPAGDAVVRRVRRRAAARTGAAVGGTTVAVVATLAVGAAVMRAPDRASDAVAGGACRPATHHLASPSGLGTADTAEHRTDRIDYDRTPPNSGQHAPGFVTDPRRRYDAETAPPVERVVHNLEHGYVVVWYDPGRADVAALDAVLADAPRKVFAVAWTRREPLPAPYVLTAWGHEQRCGAVSGEALAAFAGRYGGANGDAPEGNAP